jgi:hypothetical protein
MWSAKSLQVFALGAVWKTFGKHLHKNVGLMHNKVDNKHKRGYLFKNLYVHTTMDIYENNNTIITKTN